MLSQPPEPPPPRKELHVSHATERDIPELANLHVSAFTRPPVRQVMYRDVLRSTLVQNAEARFATIIAAHKNNNNDSPSANATHLLKINDPNTNEIMALIIWIHLPNGYSEEEDVQTLLASIPDGVNERLWNDFSVKTGELRSQHPGRAAGHWLLELLGTHPKHERQGAASKLVRWAFERADAGGMPCFVDASAYGHVMYQRCGFVDVGEMAVDLEAYEPGCGFEVQRWKAMVREPAGGRD